jgi:hypothetical protein
MSQADECLTPARHRDLVVDGSRLTARQQESLQAHLVVFQPAEGKSQGNLSETKARPQCTAAEIEPSKGGRELTEDDLDSLTVERRRHEWS